MVDRQQPLLTIAAISKELGVPESTLRYYRTRFAPHIPTTGRGRQRRHHPEAVEIFRTIVGLFAQGYSGQEIDRMLMNREKPAFPPGSPPATIAADGSMHSKPHPDNQAPTVDQVQAAFHQVTAALAELAAVQQDTNHRLEHISQLLEDPANRARRRMEERQATLHEKDLHDPARPAGWWQKITPFGRHDR